MKKLALLLSLILTVILIFSVTACKGSRVLSLTAFNTIIRIEAHDKNISKKTQNELSDLFSSLEKQFDGNDDLSFVYSLNNDSANQKIETTTTASEVLALSKEYYAFSEQKFNPAVYPLVKLWGFDNFSSVISFLPPSDDKVQELMAKNVTDYDGIVIVDNFVYKANAEAKIDLGGLVKGYAVDKALEIMLEAGHQSGYINIGNSSMALLNVESLNVSHPRASGKNILTVNAKDLFNVTLSTSGDYERYFEYEGKKYSHIIDPSTGYPVDTGIASATVLGSTGAFSDAMTTALCICNRQTELIPLMQKIIENYPQCQIYVVYEKDGLKQIITNKKQGEAFSLLDNEYSVVNI